MPPWPLFLTPQSVSTRPFPIRSPCKNKQSSAIGALHALEEDWWLGDGQVP